MTLLRYLLIFAGFGLLIGAGSILAWDLYLVFKSKKQLPGESSPPFQPASPLETGGAAGDPLVSALAGGLEHRGRAQRLGRSPGESIHGNAAPDAVSWGAPDPADDRKRGTVSDARERVHDIGDRRPEEEGRHARADQRRPDGGPGGYGALSRGSVEARIYSRQLAAAARRRDDRSGGGQRVS